MDSITSAGVEYDATIDRPVVQIFDRFTDVDDGSDLDPEFLVQFDEGRFFASTSFLTVYSDDRCADVDVGGIAQELRRLPNGFSGRDDIVDEDDVHPVGGRRPDEETPLAVALFLFAVKAVGDVGIASAECDRRAHREWDPFVRGAED